MPFDNTPGEGSGGGSNKAFWDHVHKVAGCTYAFLLPSVLGSLFEIPKAGCLGMWTPSDTKMHALRWGEKESQEPDEYTTLVTAMALTAGQFPTNELSAKALSLAQHGAFHSTRVSGVPLFMALATNEKFGAMQVAGILSMSHIFGDPLDYFRDYCEHNTYWYAMYQYFSQADVRSYFTD